MKTTHAVTIGLVALWLGEAAAFAVLSPFQPGEILLNSFGGYVQRYSSTGVLEQTYTGTGNLWEGASLTPDGNLVTSRNSPNSGVNIFNPAGTQIASLGISSGLTGDVSVFANGTLALNDQDHNGVKLFSQSGALLSTINLQGVVSDPFGSTVGADNILYVAGLGSNNLAKLSQTGAFLGTINLGFAPGDLVMSPTDGTLWVSERNNHLVEHITTTGTVLGSFATGLTGSFSGIGIAPDGNSLYVMTETGSVIRHLTLSGVKLGDFNIVNPNGDNFLFLTVVPVPEPSTWIMGFALSCAALLGSRRKP